MIELRCGDWRKVLRSVDAVDAVITDTPYSETTHKGHNYTHAIAGGKVGRRKIDYGHFTPDDVRAFVEAWAPRCRGWFVTITDDVLAPIWKAELARARRYVFASLPFVSPGSRCRLAGDGPSSWTSWIIVARPKQKAFSTWGTLPGAYVLPSERDGGIVGGKPIALMRALVRDYTRRGDLVCDPCAGDATTLIAAAIEGRRSIGAEIARATYRRARRRIARGFTPALPLELVERKPAEQIAMFPREVRHAG